MSYRKKHVKNKISRIKPRKSIFKRPWFWVLILILIIICTAFYFFLFYSGLQASNIVISGNEKVKTQDLRELVLTNINTGLINIWQIKITSRSIFLVDTDKLNKEILEKFPVIEKIKIDKNLPQTLILGVVERKPLGVYCNNQEQCFLIDQNGIIFEPVYAAPEGATIVRQASDNNQVFTGEEAVAQNIITAISKIQKTLKDSFQISVTDALISSPLRLNIKTSESWQIYFDLSPDSDINLQLTKLSLLLSGEIEPDSRKNLRYINLIPKDRAIICDNNTCGG